VAGKASREHTVAMTFSDTDAALLRAIRDLMSEILGKAGKDLPRPADTVGRWEQSGGWYLVVNDPWGQSGGWVLDLNGRINRLTEGEAKEALADVQKALEVAVEKAVAE
jgi:hypothetical protein